MSTSCVAPAFVYLEGSRGKRFLCDFHYYYEKNITINRTPELWKEIESVFFEKLETIKETFDQSANKRTFLNLCWCGAISYVATVNKFLSEIQYECNFHYRKTHYRLLSNGINKDNIYTIDERKFLKKTIKEEAESLKKY